MHFILLLSFHSTYIYIWYALHFTFEFSQHLYMYIYVQGERKNISETKYETNTGKTKLHMSGFKITF